MFRFDIKTFERETVRLSVKNRQNIGGERRTRKKSRNDKNEERTDYEGKLGSGIHPPLHKGSTTATQYT